jgi:nitrate/nitrite-specific signal transduction histidine kinase
VLGLRERASEIGADFAVRSTLGQGAEVVLRAPYVAPRRTRAWVTPRAS